MKLFRIIAVNEGQILLRNRFQLQVLGLFFLAGIYSIYYGHTEIRRQSERIGQAADSVSKAQALYRQLLQADTSTASGKKDYEKAALPSLVRFQYNFVTANTPLPLAALSLGQRDLYPYYFILTAQNLYTQTFKGEIYNPFKLAAGNFDLSFVMIYLMPLLIIGLCFDVLSFEKDTGTFALLRTSNFSFRSIVLCRLLFRYLLVAAVTVLLSVTGFIVAGIPLSEGVWLLLAWLAVLLLYNGLWLALLLFINSFNKSTSFNAAAAISAWILLLIVVPATLNLAGQSNRQTSAIPFATLMRSRSMPDTDSAMQQTLQSFYTYYPTLNPGDSAVKSPFFKYQGYSAFLAVDQRKSAERVDAFYRQVSHSAETSERFNLVNPAVNTQEMLNSLAATDLKTELDFKAAVRQFHDSIFWFSNKPLFTGKMMTAEAYDQPPAFHFRPPVFQQRRLSTGLLQLACCALLLAMAGWRKLGEGELNRR
ncbi:MAG: DUF3526 domain-containing protein [Flavihumibacter sp.]